MTKKFTYVMAVVIFFTVIVSAYLLPYMQANYGLSTAQELLLALILIIGIAIITVGAAEYAISYPLVEFLSELEHNWGKYESLNISPSRLDSEKSLILHTITGITSAQTVRIKELESTTGNSSAYQRLLTTASHQLRTPLTGLKWAFSSINADIARGAKPDPAIMTGTSESMARISNLIEELLAGLGDQSKPMFSFKAVDVEQCLDNVIKESALLAARQNLSVSVVKQDALIPLIRGKEQEIGFVLHSLITNALYYGTKGSIVTVTITHESNQVKIAVHNTGQAVPENEKALIFSQFSRSSEAIRLNPDGYGLALYLTHQIIVDHNGTISFASDSKHGTIFTITLPISSHGRLETSINY